VYQYVAYQAVAYVKFPTENQAMQAVICAIGYTLVPDDETKAIFNMLWVNKAYRALISNVKDQLSTDSVMTGAIILVSIGQLLYIGQKKEGKTGLNLHARLLFE
jgi:hypothetical protein